MSTPEELYKKDNQYVWHHMKPYQKNQNAMVVQEADGAWITDIEGNQLLDGMSGLWCVNAGYGRTELADAAAEQLRTLPYYPLSNSHVPAIELADKLNDWLEGEYRIVYANSGSEANETAFKLARQYHKQNGSPQKYKFISRYRSYHGSTLGALAATGQAQRKYLYEPLPPGFVHVHAPEEYRIPNGKTFEEWSLECAQMIEDTIIWERPETVAGVIMEPIITGGGILIPHDSYLKKVEQICRKHNVLLMIDEVICGFGRTGKKFGFQHYNITPDIVTMAKGITSGYLPLAASAVRQEIYEPFKEEGEDSHFRHVNTFGGNPAACRLALKNLEIMEKEDLCTKSKKNGDKLREKLAELESHPNVGNIRHKGLLVGLELVEDKYSKKPASSSYLAKIMGECKKNGLIVGKNADTVSGYSNVLTLAPPLNITEEDLTFIVKTLKNAFND
ncbi:aspartate aminotransferase family protein [Alteribacillus sp. YIM 98480]|uniref:aspartate aminotransferase family protein n=1 Tax=Alteribacillus sp. YIM 98480 TaxID=2606599 RepID=UPI00131C24B1|nr:aspartate aminotransferase family protein [Alteribacillus sp. YIM 98480]